MTRKTLIAASILLTVTAMPSHASLMFNFDYSDNVANVGFLDNTEGAARQSALETAGNLFSNMFGSYFSNSGTIDLSVTSTDDSNSGTLASAGSNFVSSCSGPSGSGGCVVNEVVKTKLQTGVDANGADTDGSVDVNWGWNWQLDADTPADPSLDEFDFYAAIFHELTHALGFSSAIFEDGSGLFNDEWAAFDIFLQNSNGTNIIDDEFYLSQGVWDAASVGGTGNGLFFGGANAVAANGGNLVGIYSPTTWAVGSSGSHLDGAPFPTDMMKYDRDFGPETRGYSAVDVGVLTDLGYSRVTDVPEPSTFGIGIVGLLSLMFARRRKN
ncbi:PEP-CTERM sorting domain-containing protein [Paraglaciecola sp. 20A4]|uniref:PEP-CTERM sorting domain-containing protein n=1 Tax=Paraglaciecola sp. 20A4 TaxID=2687288 RepID=UPI001408772E|nr:PEP-CTERM sorting domain-containing protein [Paraglaciecola sp. 20A4]